ncbi:MAG TPA: sterol desaturase family protein [Kofleriaceae bacterium]|nr:sterol desaturase family protein [Kofleriaceae bacterium]
MGPGEWVFVGLAPLCVLAEQVAPRVAGPPLLAAVNRRRIIYLAARAVVGAIAAFALVTLTRGWRVPWRLDAAGVPFAARCALALVLVDLKQYWVHRADHRVAWLWRFHRVHHAATPLNWLASAETHLLAVLVFQLGSSIVLVWLVGLDPAAYLIGAVVPSMVIGALFAHLNVDVPRGPLPWWARVVNTPNVHARHHARRPDPANFAEVLVLWDVLFGTFEAPAATPPELGLAGETLPDGIVAAQLSPFRRAGRPRRYSPLDG